ncbi:MAG: hypothetical protein MI924_29735 [Chloroflexales bacterium]|nr:hypothetical protein [Chloroflexales bacterium]
MYNYLASLPERAVRATAAGAGGFLHETTELVLPRVVRQSRFYQSSLGRLLRIMVELVGGVKDVFPQQEIDAKELAVRKLAGNAVEVAGFMAIGWSPVWLLAAAADLTNGTHAYLNTLVAELKRVRVLPETAQVKSVDQLLTTLERTTGTVSDTLDIPPLNVNELRTSLKELQQNMSNLPDGESLARLFTSLQQAAQQENRSLLSLSSAVAVGAVQAGGNLGSIHVFGYYQEALRTIMQEGLPVYLRRVAKPYIKAAAHHFNPGQATLTERWLRYHRERRAARNGQANE